MSKGAPEEPRGLRGYRARARRLLEDPRALNDTLDQAQGKLAGALGASERLRAIGQELTLMVRLLRAWLAGEYRGISRPALLSIAAALLYFVVPLDGIPDFLFGFGFIDDAAVITFVLHQVRQELLAFRRHSEEAAASDAAAAAPDSSADADSPAPVPRLSYCTRPANRKDLRQPLTVLLLAIVLWAPVFLSGCSLKLAYNNADRLIRWGIDDFVDLNATQTDFLNAELDRLLYWHRTTQLPIYASYLEQLNARVAAAAGAPPTLLQADIQAFGEVAEGWAKVAELKSQRLVLQLLLSLTPEQLVELPDRMRRANDEAAEAERNKSLDESRQHWVDAYAKTFKRFTGRLNAEQLVLLEDYALRYEPQYELWIQYRERWQRELFEVLRSIDRQTLTVAAAEQHIVAMNEARETYYGEFGPVFRRNERLAQEAAAAVLVTLTQRQRDRANKRVNEIVATLRELVEEAPAAVPPALTAADCLVQSPRCPWEQHAR